jgi:hypothetical protein
MRYAELITEAIDTDTPGFKAWFANSKVMKHGKPMMMFHGTGASFEEFHRGSHFGTARAANHRLGQQGLLRHQGRMLPVYLSIKNPLRLKADLHSADEAALLNAIKRGEYPDINLDFANQHGAYAAAEAAGYDGLVYKNGMEDRGKLSWVVFRPEQVRSAIS